MSANGTLSSTLDYQFFGGGVIRITGEVSGIVGPSLVSFAEVPIYAESSNNFIDFTFAGGIETPTIYATAAGSIDFSAAGTIEFGITRNAFVEWKSIQIPFSANSEARVAISGSLDQTLEFSLDTNIFIFSDFESAGTFGFTLQSKGINVSRRYYSKDGASYCSLNENQHNDVQIGAQFNMVEILDNGERLAEIITAFNK